MMPIVGVLLLVLEVVVIQGKKQNLAGAVMQVVLSVDNPPMKEP